MRSYHIGPPPTGLGLGMSEAGLATIAEDIEEDSGGESSGHWMFSADNTDTDSVIHVPPPPPNLPANHFLLTHESDHRTSSSEETLTASEDEILKVNLENGSKTRKDEPTDIKETNKHSSNDERGKLWKEEGEKGVPADESDTEEDPRVEAVNKEVSKVGSEKKELTSNYDRPRSAEEVFDFSSLETCEVISLSSELDQGEIFNKGDLIDQHNASSYHEGVIFNTSATSQPFVDGPGKATEQIGRNLFKEENRNKENDDNNGISRADKETRETIDPKEAYFKMASEDVNLSSDNVGKDKVGLNNIWVDEDDPNDGFNNLSHVMHHHHHHQSSENDKKHQHEREDNCGKSSVDCSFNKFPHPIIPKTEANKAFSLSNSSVEFTEEAVGWLREGDLLNPTSPLQQSLSSSSTVEEVRQTSNSQVEANTHSYEEKEGEPFPLKGISMASANNKIKPKRSQRPHNRLRSRAILRHSKSSDGDTDDTDGDCEEETQFLSNAQTKRDDKQNPLLKVYQTSSFNGGSEEKAGQEEGSQTSKDVLFVGSSPEVPLSPDPSDSCQTSASASTARSVETLSEDSGLGDQNFRLTPSSPLASITEAVKGKPTFKISSLGLIRPFSLGDLRYYSSDSDSETDEVRMRAFTDFKASRISSRGGVPKTCPSQYQDPYYYLQNKTVQFNHWKENDEKKIKPDRTSDKRIKPDQTSDKRIKPDQISDKRSLNKYNNIPNKPRRHQSMYEPNTNQHLGTWEHAPRASNSHVAEIRQRNMQRPKPLSIDMAEEFLSQEGLKSPTNKFNPYVEKNQNDTDINAIHNIGGVVRNLPGYRVTNGNERGGAKFPPSQNIEEVRISNSSSTPDLTDEVAWLSARTKRHTVPSTPQYSYEPQSGSNPEKSSVEKCHPFAGVPCPASYSSAMSESVYNTTHAREVQSFKTATTPQDTRGIVLPDSLSETKEKMNRIHTKTYGTHGEVEVYVARSGDQRQLAAAPPQPKQSVETQLRQGSSRGVTFSPSVKEVNWRESYIEPDDSDYLFTQLEEKEVKKVKVISSDSPKIQRCKPAVTSFIDNSEKMKQDNLSENVLKDYQFAVQSQSFSPQDYSESKIEVKNDKVPETLNDNSCAEPFISPNALAPSSPRTSTPIWQRLKLVKIGSPKGPRPKIPPKPPSLSPRSSDSESHKLSSPSSPESGLSSPSSPEFKFKKIPTSPRFFSWGSKREKKICNSEQSSSPTTAENSPPPPAVTSPSSLTSPSPNLRSTQVNSAGKEAQVERPVIPTKNEEGKEDQREKFINTVQSNEMVSRNETPTNQLLNQSSEGTTYFNEKTRIENNFNHQNEAINNSDDFYKIRESILKQSNVKFDAKPKELNGIRNVINSRASPTSHAVNHLLEVQNVNDDSSSISAEGKPPLPPPLQNRNGCQAVNKIRLINARRQYLAQGRSLSNQESNSQTKHDAQTWSETPSKDLPELRPIVAPYATGDPYPAKGRSAAERLKERFERFSKATRAERERLARSTPDLSQIEESVRRQTPRIDCCVYDRTASSPHSGSDGDASGLSSITRGYHVTREEVRSTHRSSLRGASHISTTSPISAEFDRISQRTRTRSVGLLETDLDTGTSREFLTPQETNLDDLYQDLQNFLDSLPQVPFPQTPKEKTRAKSLLQLDATPDSPQTMESSLTTARADDSRAKSMEFLLDDENRAAAKAPENELMREGERKVSEAELRVRRSLQRLDVPEWMKAATPQQGFLLRRRDYSTGTSSGGWSGFSSKTGSMTSLGSSRANTPTKVVIPTRPSTRGYGGIISPSSTTSISPSPSERAERGTMFQYPLSRWSTSRINSGTTTPTGSFTSQKTTSYTRTPYLGWRSNTSLTSLGGSQSSLSANAYLSPAERLALSLLQSKRQETLSQKDSSETPSQNEGGYLTQQNASEVPNAVSQKSSSDRPQVADVHSSIKEVTSAIVHYCKETASPRASPRASPNSSQRDTSPRRLVWVESSFVGSRPITSPETPTTSTAPLTPPAMNGHQGELVETRPPQPPEECSLLNSFSSAGSNNIRDGSRDSTAASTNDSTAVLPDSSRADSGNSLDDNGQMAIDTRRSTSRNGRSSLSENSSRHSTADTINSAISSRGIDSLNSRNSGGSSISRQSSESRHSSSGRGGSSSREELPDSRGSCENMIDEDSSGLKEQLQGKNFLSLTDDSTLTASCHSSFGTFQIDDDSFPLTSKMKLSEKVNRLQLDGITPIRTEDTRQTINSRRFSEGASPWEPNSLSSFVKKPQILEDTWEMQSEEQGYGFNFSSYSKQTPLFQDESTSEDVGTESTTLEDVLDSLLALPSASRSPSPSSGPHPLSLVRPDTHLSFLSDEEKQFKSEFKSDQPNQSTSSYSEFGAQMEDVRYTYLRNHDFGTDPKTQTYHKSFSYPSSTFVPSKPPILHSNTKNVLETKNRDTLASYETEKTSVTFYLGKDEGNITNSSAKQGFVNHSFTSTPEMENTFSVDYFEKENFSSSIVDTFPVSSLEDNCNRTLRTSQPMTTFSQSPFMQMKQMEKQGNSNFTNELGLNSCRTSEEVVRRSSMESGMSEKKNSFPSSLTSSLKEPVDTTVREQKVTFHLPPKHMNIPPDSSSENGNGTENLRVEMEDEDDMPSSSDPTGMLVHCRNTLCNNSDTVEEARIKYKTCHNCSVFYCSRSCRRTHWEKHKHLCEKIKASTVARQVISRIRDDPAVLDVMSAVARRGILAIGRGAVKIFFANTAAAEVFVGNGNIPDAHYQPLQNIMPQEMGSETYKKIIEQCRNYNPSIKFILYVSICTFSEAPSVSSLKCRRETIAKCAKLRLSETNIKGNTNSSKNVHAEHHVITRDLNEPETLVLAAFPNSNYGLPPRQAREVAFGNIVRELQDRGVNFRLHHADVYRKLSHFVDVGGSFPPITVYPKDSRRGNSFVCIIMPDADPSRLQRIESDGSKVQTIDISAPHPPVT